MRTGFLRRGRAAGLATVKVVAISAVIAMVVFAAWTTGRRFESRRTSQAVAEAQLHLVASMLDQVHRYDDFGRQAPSRYSVLLRTK
jgi:cell division protein FtsX